LDRLHYFEPPAPRPARGVMLVIHGMNNNAGMMAPLIKVVMSCGFAAARLTLTGHDCAPHTKFDGSLDRWLGDVESAYKEILIRYPLLNISGLGFSLGGALLVASLDRNPIFKFEKLILLSPAIRLRWYLRSLQPMAFVARAKYSVFNFVPPAYRTYRFSPVTSYSNTSDVVQLVTHLQHPERLRATKVLLAMSPKDCLLELKGIPAWLQLNKLSNWQVEALNPQPQIGRTLNHLVVDEPTLGKVEWQRLSEMIKGFLL
jgi:alpha-beta hydrolase superfamily lysophospholipase